MANIQVLLWWEWDMEEASGSKCLCYCIKNEALSHVLSIITNTFLPKHFASHPHTFPALRKQDDFQEWAWHESWRLVGSYGKELEFVWKCSGIWMGKIKESSTKLFLCLQETLSTLTYLRDATFKVTLLPPWFQFHCKRCSVQLNHATGRKIAASKQSNGQRCSSVHARWWNRYALLWEELVVQSERCCFRRQGHSSLWHHLHYVMWLRHEI